MCAPAQDVSQLGAAFSATGRGLRAVIGGLLDVRLAKAIEEAIAVPVMTGPVAGFRSPVLPICNPLDEIEPHVIRLASE